MVHYCMHMIHATPLNLQIKFMYIINVLKRVSRYVIQVCMFEGLI